MTGYSPNLSKFSSAGFDRGRCLCVEVLWRVISAIFFQCPLSIFYAPKRVLLRLFGANIGKGVLIKPRVTITFPWRISIGNHSWIGEGSWLDSLAKIEIGENVCISQGAYLCTGNHNFRSESFDLITEPISVGEGAWLAAQSVVGPGRNVGPGAILGLGAIAIEDLEPNGIYQGNPAVKVGNR